MNRSIGLGLLLLLGTIARADEPAKKSPSEQPAKDVYEQVVHDMLDLLKSTAKTLGSAIDAESAKKAKVELEKLVQARQSLLERIDKLGLRSKEIDEELSKKFKPELDDAFNAMSAQVEHIAKEPFGKDLLSILQSKPPVKPPADKP